MITKQANILFFSIIGLFLCSIGIIVGYTVFESYGSIVVGIILAIISIIFYQSGKTSKNSYKISYMINYFATGLSVSTLYNFGDQTPKIDSIVVVSFMIFIAVLIFYLFARMSFLREAMPFLITFFIVTTFILSIVFWVQEDSELFGLLFFYLQISYFHIVCYYIENHYSVFRNLALISFGLFAVVTYIILVIISEGEALEALSYGFGGGVDTKKTTNI